LVIPETSVYEFLKKIPLFAGMPDDDFARLCEMVEEVRLPAGAQLFAEGSPGMRAYVIQDGELEIVKQSGPREVLLAVRGPGEVIGEMSLVERAPRMASVRARTDVALLAIHREELDKLLDSSPSAVRAILRTVLARWRNTEAQLRQSEKLAELGTLSAGIAHELNNPASAVQRGSEQLQTALRELGRTQVALAAIDFTTAQQTQLAALVEEALAGAPEPPALGALERSDLEASLESWLEVRGVRDSWECAAVLVDMGFDADRLESLLSGFPAGALPDITSLLSANHTIAGLLRDVAAGATRISAIVQALKSYTFLDQAPVQDVDVHAGLENTLTILGPRLAGIEVQRDYAPGLPAVQAYGSELNQVFTHILTNAIDALAGEGRIVIRTRAEGDMLVIEIEDNGPGIPEEIAPRVFDPFFTTKPPGQGAGLGLSSSYNIVVEKHRGSLELVRRPGVTCFRVMLPAKFEQEKKASQAETQPAAEPEFLREILESTRSIAVVGMSGDSRKAANTVPLYLRDHGYEVMPVNPRGGRIGELRTYPDLLSLPKAPDVVLVFRPSEEAPGIVALAIQIGARVVWMQRGIRHEAAAAQGREAGLQVVMDTCMREAHRRLVGERQELA
jgi:signal transduction histidine kinase/predicted CoA-binding protein